jgi:hypothetical protein
MHIRPSRKCYIAAVPQWISFFNRYLKHDFTRTLYLISFMIVCENGYCGFKWCAKTAAGSSELETDKRCCLKWSMRIYMLYSQGVSTEFIHVCSFSHRPLCVCVCKLPGLCIVISHHLLRCIELYLNIHSTCCLQNQRRRFWRSRLYT